MPSQAVQNEQCKFDPSSLLELWKLDGRNIGLDTIYYFYDGSAANYQAVVYNGVSYIPFPIKVENMAADGKGSLPRPKLTLSNIHGFISSLLLETGQLVGAQVTRTRVFARFLDAVNFPVPVPNWVTPDPSAAYAPEPFVVNRKIIENAQVVQFELSSPLEINGIKLPGRQIIANVCKFAYRGSMCRYSGPPIADVANRTFTGYYNLTLSNQGNYDENTTYNAGDYVTFYSSLPTLSSLPMVYVCIKNGTLGSSPPSNPANWVLDQCAKSVAACSLRFTTEPLRTSAFPGTSRSPWISQS